MNVVFWPTMNNTHPWWKEKGKPFRLDRPDWLMYPERRDLTSMIPTGRTFKESVWGNCIANKLYWDWIIGIQLDGMRAGNFLAYVMDGDFFGGGGMVLPADCPSDQHDHLPGDSNYACESTLNRMFAKILEAYPRTCMFTCRPAQDLGVWSNRYLNAVFTLDEFAAPEPLPGIGQQPTNVMLGNKIRRWSRIRVHHHFFPHYLDQPQVFAAPKSMHGPAWSSAKIDYVMLSVAWAFGPPMEMKIGSGRRCIMDPAWNGEGRLRSG